MRFIPFVLMMMLATAAKPADEDPLHRVLEHLGVNEPDESLRAAPIPGFFEVTRGMQVLYVAQDGELVINGDILSVSTEANLTEMRRNAIRHERLQSMPDDATLLLRASVPASARIVVFTDTDCRYCQLLHRRHKELLDRGIEIQYLFYPRSGPGSESFKEAVSVWCSGDRPAALETALNDRPLPESTCAHPVLQHYRLARELDLKGTPAVIAANGAVQYGLYSPKDILEFSRQGRMPGH